MKKLLVIAALSIGAFSLQAEDHFFQLSLTPDIALQPKTDKITGISLNIWAENPQRAFSWGFVNGSSGDSSGFTLSFIDNYDETYTGVAWSLVNISKVEFTGWQSSLVNYSTGKFTGVQTAWFNYAQECHGLQWGVVNYAENLHGVQIGLANIASNNGWFNEFPDKLATGFPFFNWSF